MKIGRVVEALSERRPFCPRLPMDLRCLRHQHRHLRLGGRAHVVIDGLPGLRAHIESGDLKPLAIMSKERLAILPDLPTATETVPGLTAIGWAMVAAPRTAPTEVVKQLTNDLAIVFKTAEVQARLEKVGTPFQPIFGDALVQSVEDERKLWNPIVRQTIRN